MTVEQFAYLRCPSKIRAAIINEGGPRLSVEAIQHKLSTLPRRIIREDVGEPTEHDGRDFRVNGLVKPGKAMTVSAEERAKIEALAKAIPNKPKPEPAKVFRYRAPRTNHVGTAYADGLIDRACKELKIPRKVLLSKARYKYLVAVRSMICVLLRERNAEVYSYPRIASILKRKDHTTVIYAFHHFEDYCTLYPDVAALYLEMRESGR